MTPPNPTPECPIDFPLVILESPYAGSIHTNTEYAQECMRDCLLRGEAPYASHLLYTQDNVLDGTIPDERSLGIRAGMAWGAKADKTVVYVDREISGGMKYGILKAESLGRPVEFRSLYYNDIVVVVKTKNGNPPTYVIELKNLGELIKKERPWLPETMVFET